jgi:hypothetical protein
MAISAGLAANCSTPSSGGIGGLHIGNSSDFNATIDNTTGVVTALVPTAAQVMYAVDILGTKNATFTEASENDPEVGGSESMPSLKFRVQCGSATDKFINMAITAANCGIVAIFKRGGTENNIAGYDKEYPLNIVKVNKNITGELKTGAYYEVEFTSSGMPLTSNSRVFTGTVPA